ncbi:MAG: PH domain-containing protein [Coriobacteriaceae bacterium]|nr:PH domain-containing protein [Coriobacteriaceae bacterium]
MLIMGGITVLLLALIVGLVFFTQRLSYKHLWYELGAEEFSLYSGIFNKKKVHVPYQRVQSVNQRASLTQRLFGVCTVHIDTAGGASNKAVVVPYVRKADAEWLRSEMFARKEYLLGAQTGAPMQQASTHIAQQASTQTPAQATQAPAGAAHNILDTPANIMADARGVFGGARVESAAASYEYGLSNKELVFTGLSNNTSFALVALAVVGSLAAFAAQALSLFFGDSFYEQGFSLLVKAFTGQVVWAIVVPLVVVIFVVWAASLIGTCVSYGGFKARRRQNRIEVEYGLLQHQFHGVDIDRVQSVILKQSFIRRLIGYCELSLGKIEAQVDNSQNTNYNSTNLNIQKGLIIHPFVKMSKVPEILAGLVPEFADVPTETIKLPKVALRRALIRRCILKGGGFWTAVAVAIAHIILVLVATVSPEVYGALPAIKTIATVLYVTCAFIIVMEAINAVLWYRSSCFAFNRNFMQISNGGFSRESVSFPRKKIQYGYGRTTPFQRAAKVATINARTAAGVGGTTISLMDAYEEDVRTWLNWLIPRHDRVE